MCQKDFKRSKFKWDRDTDERVRDAVGRVEQHIEAHAGPAVARMQQRLARQAERAARRAERQVKHEKIQAKVEQALQRAGVWLGEAERAAAPPPAARTEERLAILRMVETGKISPDDAARLLDAL